MGCYGSIERQVVDVKVLPVIKQTQLKMKKNPFELLNNADNCVGKQSNRWYVAKLTYPEFAYNGQWDKGFPHGKGRLYNMNQSEIIYGYFNNGRLSNSKCVKITNNSAVYVGSVNNQLHMEGYGRIKSYKDSIVYDGEFNDNQITGKGTLKLYNQNFEVLMQTRIGYFEGGQLTKGSLITNDGMYQGTFQNNKLNQVGIFIWAKGGKYVGEFKKGKKNGKGILYDSEGTKVRVGQWFQDQIIY